MFEPMWPALLLLSPVLLFSVSRGYDGGALALLLGLGVSGFYFNQGETPSQQQGHVLLMSFSVLLLLGWKGFPLLTAATVWFGVLMAGFLWIALNHRLTKHHDDPVTQHPWKMAECSSVTVLLLVVMYGGMSSSGTFAIVSQQPLLFSSPFLCLFDTLVLYILIGFALWPFVWNRMEGLRSMRAGHFAALWLFLWLIDGHRHLCYCLVVLGIGPVGPNTCANHGGPRQQRSLCNGAFGPNFPYPSLAWLRAEGCRLSEHRVNLGLICR